MSRFLINAFQIEQDNPDNCGNDHGLKQVIVEKMFQLLTRCHILKSLSFVFFLMWQHRCLRLSEFTRQGIDKLLCRAA